MIRVRIPKKGFHWEQCKGLTHDVYRRQMCTESGYTIYAVVSFSTYKKNWMAWIPYTDNEILSRTFDTPRAARDFADEKLVEMGFHLVNNRILVMV